MSDKPSRTELQESTNRWMWAGLVLMVLFILMFPIYRIYEPAQRAAAREEANGFLAAQGAELYEGECASCHGVEGRGGLAPAIGSRNFLESVDDEQITQLIGLGVPGTEMASYAIGYGGPMTVVEIESITTYLRSLEEESEYNPNWRTPLADEDLSGEDIYNMACARCHGIDQTGIEDLGPDISRTSFALEESDEWLFERIHDGKDEMPRFGGVLVDDQINLIIAFLRGVDPSEVGTTTTTTTPGSGSGPTTTAPSDVPEDVLALGEEVYQEGIDSDACAECHGVDGAGTQEGPNILGSSKSAISSATAGGVPDMDNIDLTDEQLEGVYQYLRTLGG